MVSMSVAAQRGTAHRWGYGFSALVNLILAWAVNVWPGWEAVPFLDDATTEVLPLVNLSLLIGFGTNVAYMVLDPPWFRALGHILTAAVSIAVLVRTLRVFPFDFSGVSDSASTWEPITRGILIFLIVASVLGLVSYVVQYVRAVVRGPDAAEG
jgi:hypothetical protein